MSIINPYPLCVSQMLCRNPVDDYVGGDEDYQRVPPVSVGRMDDAARNPLAANNVRGRHTE